MKYEKIIQSLEHNGYTVSSFETSTTARLDLLNKYYEKTAVIKALIYSDVKLKGIKDDVIDALCRAVTAMLGYRDGFKTIPENPMKDSRGILMQLVYATDV